jgi:serine-type D-Ala-D-Ala carboxypeptidase/endopeptidase
MGGQPFAAGHAAVAPERVEFEIGSLSKVFTGLLLAQAVHEGKLALTDTLAMRLPVQFASREVGGITLKQLATHTSCLPRLPDNMVGADSPDPYAAYTNADLFAYLAQAKLPSAPPCAPDYSNLGFGVLGVVLERMYGQSWDTLVHNKITLPLGMADTVQHLSTEQRARLAQGWSEGKQVQPWTFQAMAGAGALVSTAADLTKLADAMLAGAGGPLRDAWQLMSADQSDAGAMGGHIGLALMHDRLYGQDRYWHDGGTGGFRSTFQVFPADGRAQIVLTSSADGKVEAWLTAWRAEGRTPVAWREITLPAGALDEYTGVYQLSPQARFTILRVGDDLRVRLTGQQFLPVFASAKDEFFYRAVDAQLSFQRQGGRITGLVVHQYGRDLLARRTADPVPHVEFLPVAALAELAGDYDFSSVEAGAVLTVRVRGEGLTAQLTGQPMVPVFAVAKDRFQYDVVEATLAFERDAAGKVSAVVLNQNGATVRAPRKHP